LSKDVCICGNTYSEHPEAEPPTPLYRAARIALAHVIHLPGTSKQLHRAIVRARLERSAATR
jgi:hypothetical protein